MAMRIGGFRRKTRYRLKKHFRNRGKISLTRFMQTFAVGDKVHIGAEPAYQKGMCFPMYMGKTGTVKGQRGRCFEILIKDHNKEKTVVVHPVHLKRAQ